MLSPSPSAPTLSNAARRRLRSGRLRGDTSTALRIDPSRADCDKHGVPKVCRNGSLNYKKTGRKDWLRRDIYRYQCQNTNDGGGLLNPRRSMRCWSPSLDAQKSVVKRARDTCRFLYNKVMAHELDDFKTCKKHVPNNNCAEVKQSKIYTLYSPVLGGHKMNAEVRKLNCAEYYCARNKRDAIRDTRAREIEPRTFLPLRPRPRPSPTRAQCRRHR